MNAAVTILSVFLLLFCVSTAGLSPHAAEYALITDAEKSRLIELVKTNLSAKIEFEKLKAQADAGLKHDPRPIKSIQTEGRLNGDPEKSATQAALKDMALLQSFGYAYLVTGETKYADKAREYILAWAKANEPSGNPINETNLEPLIVSYDLTRKTFDDAGRKTVDGYLRRLFDAELGAEPRSNNWQSHRLKIMGLAAYVLNDSTLINTAVEGFKRQIEVNLRPDGSSTDLHDRDALHYHVYDVEPLLALAIAASKHGINLYDYTSESGAALRKSVRFLIPYCTGELQHEEFVHSKVKFDQVRASNGQEDYQAGHLFKPEQGFKALTLAAYFDDAVNPAIAQLVDKPEGTLASWVMVLNAARVPDLKK